MWEYQGEGKEFVCVVIVLQLERNETTHLPYLMYYTIRNTSPHPYSAQITQSDTPRLYVRTHPIPRMHTYIVHIMMFVWCVLLEHNLVFVVDAVALAPVTALPGLKYQQRTQRDLIRNMIFISQYKQKDFLPDKYL